MRFAVDGQSPNAKLEARRDIRQRSQSTLTSGQTVRDNADMVALIDLPIGEVDNMSENSTDWRAHGVQNAKGAV